MEFDKFCNKIHFDILEINLEKREQIKEKIFNLIDEFFAYNYRADYLIWQQFCSDACLSIKNIQIGTIINDLDINSLSYVAYNNHYVQQTNRINEYRVIVDKKTNDKQIVSFSGKEDVSESSIKMSINILEVFFQNHSNIMRELFGTNVYVLFSKEGEFQMIQEDNDQILNPLKK